MGDLVEEKSESMEKNSKQEIVNSQETEKNHESNAMTPNLSDEKVETLHESVESKHSVEPTILVKVDENADKFQETTEEKTPEKNNENNQETSDEKPASFEEKKDQRTEQEIESEEKLKNKNKTETTTEKNRISDSLLCSTRDSREKIIRNQSDIFSLKDISTTLQTSIFSVNGCPSRRVFRKQEPAGHVFQRNDDPPADKIATPRGNRITKENYNDEKRPSSSYRNPLTGSGLSSNDEYKSKGIKRKDGNPLLGLGYDSEVASARSQHRIPPGGYSHKLW